MRHPALLLLALTASVATAAPTEFCLDGEFNLGARFQGTAPGVDEFVPTRWCVVTEDDSMRARFFGSGKSNPDLEGDWTVAVLPPDLVRIVNAGTSPDVEFQGADAASEAARIRRIDPRRLQDEHAADLSPKNLHVDIVDGHVQRVVTSAELPLRGRVPVIWHWDWAEEERPGLTIEVDGDVMFRARGTWRELGDEEALSVWKATPGGEPTQVPGEYWPARVNLRRENIGNGVFLVRGVRTGFQHLVVDTDAGLVVADAPAGWVELHQIPPTDLVPGLGISGLSEVFVDFLHREFPERPIAAVALTHAHDDHAGGARAFAAEGAAVYAPAAHAAFLEKALNRDTMPRDRFTETGNRLDVIPVAGDPVVIGRSNRVRIVPVGAGPHGAAALGVEAAASGVFFVSDLHVPPSSEPAPPAGRAATECWFARWAVDSLPADTVVVNSHSLPRTPVSRLRQYLQSEACLERQS